MKKLLALLLLILQNTVMAIPFEDHTIPSNALAELLAFFNIPEDQKVAQTQQQWLRKGGKERWEMEELTEDRRRFVLDWAKKQGLYTAWKASQPSYDKALILGANTYHMETRLAYLKKLYQDGIRFKEIVWLVGERPLDARVDGLMDVCKTESQAARHIWAHADLPPDMKLVPVQFVDSPMKTENGILKRPTTDDTIIDWLKTTPAPCTSLFISDQPFCGYQFAVIKTLLPYTFQFDVAGDGADPSSHSSAAAITLDAIARWIYQENI